METPETRYAKSGDVSIAYQVMGEGPFDVVFVPRRVMLRCESPSRDGHASVTAGAKPGRLEISGTYPAMRRRGRW